MNQTPEYPRTPEGMKAWLESLGSSEIQALTATMASSLSTPGSGRRALGLHERHVDEIELPEPPEQPVLLTVHVSLDDTDPQVWRRLTIPGDLDLDDVHHVLQAAMGWTDSHLHRFHLGDAWSGPHFLTGDDLDEGEDGTAETEARLDQILRTAGDELGYTYDFGDGWNHTLRLESLELATELTPATSGTASRVVCLDGAGACPPEDVGGIPGYEEMAEWVRHGYDAAHAPEGQDAAGLAELRTWLPPGWHPDEFSVDEVTVELARWASGGAAVPLALLPEELQVFVAGVSRPSRFDVDAWLAHPDWRDPVTLDRDTARAVTRPVRVVRDLVGDGIALTSAGYLPPPAVEQIFTALDLKADWIGKGNREDLTPPVAELREAVHSLGLIRKVKGRLVPTALGRRLADDPERLLAQVAQRLPLEKDAFGRLTSLVLLLAVGGGVPYGRGGGHGQQREQRHELLDVVCRVVVDAGWRTESGPLTPHDVMRATRQTCHLLDLMLHGDVSTAVTATLARLILSNAA